MKTIGSNTARIAATIIALVLVTTSAFASNVLKTGQTVCYSTQGVVIPCTGTGQDGDYQAGISITDPGRFVHNGDGTITDNVTGLMWLEDSRLLQVWKDTHPTGQKCSTYIDSTVALKIFNNSPMDYTNYLKYIKVPSTILGKYNDWRIPSATEFMSLLNYGWTNSSEWLTSNGFISYNSLISSTPYPEWPTNNFYFSIGNGYGGHNMGNWHGTGISGQGNTTNANSNSCIVRGTSIKVLDITQPVNSRLLPIPGKPNMYLDTETDLVWFVNGNKTYSNEAALLYAKSQNMRLPNINELISVYDYVYSSTRPISTSYGYSHFPDFISAGNYWSSTTVTSVPTYAWVLIGGSKSTICTNRYPKTLSAMVLLVTYATQSDYDSVFPPEIEEVIEEEPVDQVNVPVDEFGSFVVTDATKEIYITSLGKDASYVHNLYAVISGKPHQYLFNSADTGTTVSLGKFPVGTVINFKLEVVTTNYSYYTGLSVNNPDDKVHCRIQKSSDDMTWTFGFEDMYGGGDQDYNDCNFVVNGVVPTIGSEVVVTNEAQVQDIHITDFKLNTFKVLNNSNAYGNFNFVCKFHHTTTEGQNVNIRLAYNDVTVYQTVTAIKNVVNFNGKFDSSWKVGTTHNMKLYINEILITSFNCEYNAG